MAIYEQTLIANAPYEHPFDYLKSNTDDVPGEEDSYFFYGDPREEESFPTNSYPLGLWKPFSHSYLRRSFRSDFGHGPRINANEEEIDRHESPLWIVNRQIHKEQKALYIGSKVFIEMVIRSYRRETCLNNFRAWAASLSLEDKRSIHTLYLSFPTMVTFRDWDSVSKNLGCTGCFGDYLQEHGVATFQIRITNDGSTLKTNTPLAMRWKSNHRRYIKSIMQQEHSYETGILGFDGEHVLRVALKLAEWWTRLNSCGEEVSGESDEQYQWSMIGEEDALVPNPNFGKWDGNWHPQFLVDSNYKHTVYSCDKTMRGKKRSSVPAQVFEEGMLPWLFMMNHDSTAP